MALAVHPVAPAADPPLHTAIAAEHGAAVLEPAADADSEAAELEQLMRQLGVGSSSYAGGSCSGGWDGVSPCCLPQPQLLPLPHRLAVPPLPLSAAASPPHAPLPAA
jgi:hypothetical protein